MAQELTTQTGAGTELAHAPQTGAQSMLAMIAEAARDPTVDAQKMVTLADLALKLKAAEQQEQFNRDKVAALFQMPSIGKRGAITNREGKVQSRYSKFEDIHRVVVPILRAHNLMISFDVDQSGPMVTVQPILSHVNGFVERGGKMPLSIDTTGSKNATQGAGSAASYGKRHTMKAMLNIVEHAEDDDGQGAGGNPGGLNPEQGGLIAAGEAAARGGADAYAAWLDGLPADQRGWLVVSGHHAAMKPGAQGSGQQGGAAAQERRSPAQLVDDYVTRVEGLTSVEALQELQTAPGTIRFTERIKASDQALFQRITEANSAAYTRLGGG